MLNKKLVLSLQDISWKSVVPKGDVTYEYHIFEETDGTRVRFYLGDLSVDPKRKGWYDSYNTSDEISAIEGIIHADRI